MAPEPTNFILAQSTKNMFQEPLIKSQLQKWDMVKGMQFETFRYTKYYHKMQAQEFVLDLLNDPSVQAVFKVLNRGGQWLPVAEPLVRVEVEVVPSTMARMDVFDKIVEASPSIVRSNGDIVKCMDDVRDGFQVSDMLRDLLLNEESDNAELLADSEKQEFLWHTFEHICLGGPCCQFEDRLEPYLDSAKKVYKGLVSAQKNTTTGEVEISSVVYRIKSIQSASGNLSLFPVHSRNSFCYIAVDPLRRTCKLWYHAFIPFW